MTSTASTSVASMTSTASFHQKTYWAWCFRQPWHHNDLFWPLNVGWIFKNPLFYWFLVPFFLEAVEGAQHKKIKTDELGINAPISWTCRIQKSSKNQNLYPHQSRITFKPMLWDTLYKVFPSFVYITKLSINSSSVQYKCVKLPNEVVQSSFFNHCKL